MDQWALKTLQLEAQTNLRTTDGPNEPTTKSDDKRHGDCDGDARPSPHEPFDTHLVRQETDHPTSPAEVRKPEEVIPPRL